jgi:hypothetical protein
LHGRLSNNVTVNLSNNVMVSLSNNVTVSLSNNVMVSLSNNVMVSLSNNVMVSLSNHTHTPAEPPIPAVHAGGAQGLPPCVDNCSDARGGGYVYRPVVRVHSLFQAETRMATSKKRVIREIHRTTTVTTVLSNSYPELTRAEHRWNHEVHL